MSKWRGIWGVETGKRKVLYYQPYVTFGTFMARRADVKMIASFLVWKHSDGSKPMSYDVHQP